MRRDGEFEHKPAPGAAQPNGLQGIDPDWLSSTIGSIYDCVLQPENWKETIQSIATRFSFSSSLLAILQLRPDAQGHEIKAHFGFDDEWIAAGEVYAADSIAIWGGAQRIEGYPLDEPIVGSHVLHRASLPSFRYYREILEPRGVAEAALIKLASGPQLVGYFALNRHVSAGSIEPDELHGLRLLAPHLRRAVTISSFFDLQAIEHKTFASVLDGMACAVVLVDERLGIVHANRAAAEMLATGELIQNASGTLGVGGRLAEDAIRAAVRQAAENEALLGQRGIGIPAVAKDNSPAMLHVLPLRRSAIRSGLSQRAVAAVFVVAASARPNMPVAAISLLYNLTPTESAIFASLCEGLSLAQTAEALGIAKSTARTHLLRVFDKTGCNRQAGLVALAARLSLTL